MLRISVILEGTYGTDGIEKGCMIHMDNRGRVYVVDKESGCPLLSFQPNNNMELLNAISAINTPQIIED